LANPQVNRHPAPQPAVRLEQVDAMPFIIHANPFLAGDEREARSQRLLECAFFNKFS